MLDTGYYFNRSINSSTSSSVVAQEVTLADSLRQCHSMRTNALIQIIFSKIYTQKTAKLTVGDYTGIHFVLLRVANVAPIPKSVHELSYDYSYMLNRFLKRNVGIFGTGLMV